MIPPTAAPTPIPAFTPVESVLLESGDESWLGFPVEVDDSADDFVPVG